MGEKIQPIARIISMQEIGRVKNVVKVPLYWKALSMFFSNIGPRIKAKINGAAGSPPKLMAIPIRVNTSIIPHLYKLPESTYALTSEIINNAGYI
jgi:hypothetical protein